MDDPSDEEITAVHEAGHAVIAEVHRLEIRRIEIVSATHGSTEVGDGAHPPRPHDMHAIVAVAGFATVGVLLGAEAELRNRDWEDHQVPGSDRYNAEASARAHGVAEGDIDGFLAERDGYIRGLIRRYSAVETCIWRLADELGHPGQIMGELARKMIMGFRQEWSEAGGDPAWPDGATR